MRTFTYANRCAKEILRDPLNLMFGLGFPVVLLALLSAIQANIPVDMFQLHHLTPGITVFGLSFMTLFSATLIARDSETALLQRLYTTPLKASDYILGYALPILPFAVAQGAICYLFALVIGMTPSVNILHALVMIIPIAIFYIGLGLLCGSIFNVKQVGGICGALLTNLSAWLSGIWFDLELVGSAFQRIANLLPFYHAVELERTVIRGDFTDALLHLWIVLGYAMVTMAISISVFLKKMQKQ